MSSNILMRAVRPTADDGAGVLSRMSKEGLIILTGEEGRRKNYTITEAGRVALLAEYDRLKREEGSR